MPSTPALTASLLLSASFVLTSSVPRDSEIRVVYRWDMTSNKSGIAAHNGAASLLGMSCSNTLDTGSFASQPISIDLDPQDVADGSISIGDSKHPLSWNDTEDEPTCSIAWNGEWAEVHCRISSALDVDAVSGTSDVDDCFSAGFESNNLRQGISLADTSSSTFQEIGNASAPANDLDTRALIKKDTIVVDKGHPHQEAYHKQLTKNHHCGQRGCSAQISHDRSSTWQFMAQVTPFKWISAGFAVQEIETTSEGHTCKGNPGDTVCVWHNEKYTSYLVQNTKTACSHYGCGSEKKDDPFRLSSPNQFQHQDTGYYCVANSCRHKGQGYVQQLGEGAPPSS